MRRQKIIVMSEPKKEGSSLGAVLGSLTAILTLISGTLYLGGYLFLTGYYGAFNLPVGILGLSTQYVLAVSAVLFIPVGGVFLVGAIYFLSGSGSDVKGLARLKELQKNPWFYLIVIIYLLVLVYATPPTGKWFADKQVTRSFSAYKYLAEPLPFVSVQCKRAVPGLPAAQVAGDGTVTYKNLRLVASNDKYFFLYSAEAGTALVPQETVLWMGFYNQPSN